MNLIRVNGKSRILGVNVGKYPLHTFLYDYALPEPAGWPLRVAFTGNDVWKKGCFRRREHSDTFAMEYVTAGLFTFRQNRREYLAEPGTLFLVRPGADSEIACPVELATKRTVSLSGALLESMLAGVGLARTDFIRVPDPARMNVLFDRAWNLLEEKPANRLAESSALAWEFLLFAGGCCPPSDLPEELREILAYLDSRLSEQHTVETLAQRFGASPATLHRLFRLHLDDTPVNYLIHKRIEAAKQMLRFTAEPVKSVAFEVGYRNAFYFSTEFRRITGMSPKEFRSLSCIDQSSEESQKGQSRPRKTAPGNV